MEELTSTENKVAFARQSYNDSVMAYNTARETFPTNFHRVHLTSVRRSFSRSTSRSERSAEGVVQLTAGRAVSARRTVHLELSIRPAWDSAPSPKYGFL